MDAGHLAARFLASAAEHAQRPATRVLAPDADQSETPVWRVRTYAQLAADVRSLAAQLIASGLAPGDRVAIFSPNLPEWSLVDLACLAAGLVVVPLYDTSTEDQARHILADSGSRWVFVGSKAGAAKVAAIRDDLPSLERVVSFTEVSDAIPTLAAELAAAPDDLSAVDRRLADASAADLATIIYTSGTTGQPKGVMLSHRGFTHQVDVLTRYLPISADDSSLCFLPLSHALERAWTYEVLCNGCLNTYVPDARTVAEMMVKAEPTMLVSVPRLYEKVHLAAQEKVAGSPLKQKLMAWALKVGTEFHTAVHAGKPRSKALIVKFKLADKLVLGNVRHAMGGPKTVLACGGAALRKEVEEFLFACGLLVLQGYGLTEASPLVTFPPPYAYRFGTVGQVMEGGEIALGEGGEILYRGPNLMLGYWNRPDDTASMLVDGWLRTGDVGEVDADGYLKVTDRIKDLIVTSYGKNVAPAPIEGLLASDPLFEYTLLLGDNRPYLTLLVSPSMPHLEEIAKQLQVSWAHRDELFNHPEVLAEIKRRVGELTEKLANHEQIRDLRLLVEGFTQENGLLTPTLKVKRREVEKRFAQLVDDMYARVGMPRK
ncbi:MAG TPA: long-chain fatty acid--CoA ligase [Propionicimonas sp.]|nr:long-chain fatty acid--CoA ligase [Propionicimonas sp.]HQA78545.1 long-chain fatty acid--CoA ligase [Propionicimonas sp.]